jgi:hypothetical protein
MASFAIGQNAKGERASSLEFRGDVIVVYFKSDPERGAVLVKPELKRIGESSFLVGNGMDYGGPENWTAGQRLWLALDDIAFMAEFKDTESFKKSGKNPL